MRTSSEGKQASLETELHRQDENVAETDKVRLIMSNPRTPITMSPPTVANEAERRAESEDSVTLCPATLNDDSESSVTGAAKSLQIEQLVSSVVRHVKGSKGHLTQWRNCYASNAGTDCDFR